MMETAMPLMVAHLTDLIYDFEVIDDIEAKGQSRLLSWQIRDTGTNLIVLDSNEAIYKAAFLRDANKWEALIVYAPEVGFEIMSKLKKIEKTE